MSQRYTHIQQIVTPVSDGIQLLVIGRAADTSKSEILASGVMTRENAKLAVDELRRLANSLSDLLGES